MKEVNYNEELDKLFRKWEKAAEEKGHKKFCADGLMYRGEKWEKDNYIGRSDGDENNLWSKATKRVLFLLKDSNGNPNCDIREFYPGGNGKIDITNKNIAYWLYGLLSFEGKNNAPEFESLDFWNEVYPVFDNVPYAFMNAKKESGGSKITQRDLIIHLFFYEDFIKEEIEILDPDIIVCGGGSGVIQQFLEGLIYEGSKKINDWIYYNEEYNKVIIDSYHPSYSRFIKGGSATIYNDMMAAYKDFLEKYPDFKTSCRGRKPYINPDIYNLKS